jgi:Family of unknown function (DUF5706)
MHHKSGIFRTRAYHRKVATKNCRHMNLPDSIERLKYAQWLLERNLAWIAQAEVKVAVVISIDVAMVSAIAAAYTTTASKSAWAVLLSVLFGLLVAAALFSAAIVVRPQIDGPPTSFVFFGKVAKMERADYAQALKMASAEDLLKDISEQIHRNAEIALTKHHWIGLAVKWSSVSAFFWMAAISQLVRHI